MVKLISTKNLIVGDGPHKVLRITTNAELPEILRRTEALILHSDHETVPQGYGLVLSKEPREGCSASRGPMHYQMVM